MFLIRTWSDWSVLTVTRRSNVAMSSRRIRFATSPTAGNNTRPQTPQTPQVDPVDRTDRTTVNSVNYISLQDRAELAQMEVERAEEKAAAILESRLLILKMSFEERMDLVFAIDQVPRAVAAYPLSCER